MYFLLLSLQKGIYLHITHHVGISKMRLNSVFHKTLFSTALKTRFNLLNHFLDSQISFKLNSLFFRKKNVFTGNGYGLNIYHQGKKDLFLLIGISSYKY